MSSQFDEVQRRLCSSPNRSQCSSLFQHNVLMLGLHSNTEMICPQRLEASTSKSVSQLLTDLFDLSWPKAGKQVHDHLKITAHIYFFNSTDRPYQDEVFCTPEAV